ncbi:hypothetical protein MBLNU459_g2195t1 [Dothideomycetes sp. NU459]
MSANPFPYPGPDVSRALQMLVPGAITLFIALALYVTRMWTRTRPVNNLGWDDLTVSGAMLLAITQLAFSGLSCKYGVGRHSYYVKPENATKALHAGVSSQPICVWAICLAKISVACVLLRLKRSPAWQWFLYIAIVVQLGSAIAANVAQLIQCTPMSALWDVKLAALPTTHCWNPNQIQASAYVNVAISIVTDLIFSLLPITFLRNMNRPVRERCVLGLLMALGLMATIAAIMKTTLIKNYRNTKDPFWDIIPLSTWWVLELNISIIASCIPCLKSPFEQTLIRFGLMTPRIPTYSLKAYVESGDSGSPQSQLNSVQTSIRAEKSIGLKAMERSRSEDSVLQTERAAHTASSSSSPTLALPPVVANPQITKTIEVVHTLEAAAAAAADSDDLDLEWGSHPKQHGWHT